jgi:AP endonuclease-2
MTIKLMTWNVNSIVTIKQYHPWYEKEKFSDILKGLNADILCFQETKLSKDKLTREYAVPDGFDAYFSFSSVRKGFQIHDMSLYFIIV